MTKLFKVFYEGYSASDVEQLRVNRKWGLPGVKCSVCHVTWATIGVAYPSVDLSTLPEEKQYRRLWPVPLDELEDRRRPLLDLLPNGLVPPPGTDLGPLVGTGRGAFCDFVWVDPWTLLAQPEVLERLRKSEVHLPRSVPALITFKKANIRELVELELEPRTLMARAAFPNEVHQCRACGRNDATMPENIVVQRSTIPSDVDIFRDRLMTTLILATDRFVESVNRLELSGLEFREVDIA
ncbi:MAG: hypothetical protein H7Z16_08010 [Pyrinomonadaceae bacterium]|nr:hypothetical protein [Pyrinomonadaceae bacterium]